MFVVNLLDRCIEGLNHLERVLNPSVCHFALPLKGEGVSLYLKGGRDGPDRGQQ